MTTKTKDGLEYASTARRSIDFFTTDLKILEERFSKLGTEIDASTCAVEQRILKIDLDEIADSIRTLKAVERRHI